MSSSSPDQTLNLTAKKKIVRDLESRLKSLNIDKTAPICAKTLEPGSLGVPVRIQTNIFGLEVTNEPVYIHQYHVFMRADLNPKRTVEFTKRGKDDYIVSDRRGKCISIMKTAYRMFEDIFGSNLHEFWYDGQSILYSKRNLTGEKKKIDLEVPGERTDSQELEGLNCILTISKTDRGFSFSAQNLVENYDHNDLSKVNKEYAHFMELILNQYAIMNPDVHMVFENGKTFMRKPWHFNMTERDCPTVGDGKRLLTGSQKSTRQIEGPMGRTYSNACIVIDAKKASFHESQRLLDKVEIIMGKEKFNEHTIERLNHIIRGLFVSLTHSKRKRRVQITAVAKLSARTAYICVDEKNITVQEYFKQKYDIELRHPDFPLISTKERNNVNYYPMEVCDVVEGQRVTVPQQTPNESQQTTRSCAIPPATRQGNIMTSSKSLKILPDQDGTPGNEYIANSGLKVYPGALMVGARSLPGPTISFKNSNCSYEYGQWRPDKNAKYFVPGACKVWACYAINSEGGRYSMRTEDIKEFAVKFHRTLMAGGVALESPKEMKVLRDDQIKDAMKRASDANCQYILFITADNLLNLHKNIKLWERDFEIITQDVKMSNAFKIVKEGKFQTLQNIVQKTNVKLGGINYNISLTNMGNKSHDWLSPKRLIIGIAVSHAPRSFDSKGKVPSVVGFCGNFKQSPIDFIGDYVYQESNREETSLSISLIVENCMERYKLHHEGSTPEEFIVYRNGVGEGSFTDILRYEVPLLRKTVDKLASEQCKIVLIVVLKDHNVRLMLERINQKDKPQQQNIRSGIVVDSEITFPHYKEFFLNSHNTLQGTARTPRYTVLYDELEMSMNELEGMTFALAHGHQIINSAVSLPAPLYIANRYAERGRDILAAYLLNNVEEGSSDSSSSQDYHRYCDLLGLRNSRLASFRINA
ncbi:unnamed protein product [Auanema sp. JU1783]|nr:unnamed protein product [Auanema sp. JU1783]